MPVRFVTNAQVVDRTHHASLVIQIQSRQLAVFGPVRRISDTTQVHTALRLSIDAWSGRQVDGRPNLKRLRRRLRNMWVHQVELDLGMAADNAWNAATDRDGWRAL